MQWNQIADIAWNVLEILGLVVTTASLITVGTKTPAEGSKLAKLYKIIEACALLVGKAKETGETKDET